MRITRAKGVRYVILREFHVSEQSHVDSRAFLRIKNLNRDARKLVHTRNNTRHVKYENLRRGLPGRPNDTQVYVMWFLVFGMRCLSLKMRAFHFVYDMYGEL